MKPGWRSTFPRPDRPNRPLPPRGGPSGAPAQGSTCGSAGAGREGAGGGGADVAGAPLAAWRHLLAVPVPGLRAAVVLARGQEAARFTDRDLTSVVPVVAEAADLLAAALRMRELARALAPLRDVDS